MGVTIQSSFRPVAVVAVAVLIGMLTSGAADTAPAMEDLRKKLTPEQFRVTVQCGTEPPFRNAYWNNKKPGIYVCLISGVPLFASLDKFDSGTGWPSFTRPLPDAPLEMIEDRSHGMVRTEVRSASGNSHLGHVFPDGPAPLRTRYCINSAALRFIPVERLEAEGYGEFKKLFGVSGPADAGMESKP